MTKQTKQPGLFDIRRGPDGRADFRVPARTGHETQQAGAGAAAKNAGRQAKRILRALAIHEDMTMQEIRHLTGIPINAVCGRMNELEHTGRVRCVRTRNHEFSRVRVKAYAITDKGKELL